MSEKTRKKKDGERKDKKNQARRASENDVVQEANSPLQVRDQSNLTDAQPGPADTREGGNEGR
ncbi:MAG TPA: hypothetical protein VK422_09395 [Pyrinomonadaceae bacterium]|nr:hypothetical protein [Pyrinomonadaceae bacterium]